MVGVFYKPSSPQERHNTWKTLDLSQPTYGWETVTLTTARFAVSISHACDCVHKSFGLSDGSGQQLQNHLETNEIPFGDFVDMENLTAKPHYVIS